MKNLSNPWADRRFYRIQLCNTTQLGTTLHVHNSTMHNFTRHNYTQVSLKQLQSGKPNGEQWYRSYFYFFDA